MDSVQATKGSAMTFERDNDKRDIRKSFERKEVEVNTPQIKGDM